MEEHAVALINALVLPIGKAKIAQKVCFWEEKRREEKKRAGKRKEREKRNQKRGN